MARDTETDRQTDHQSRLLLTVQEITKPKKKNYEMQFSSLWGFLSQCVYVLYMTLRRNIFRTSLSPWLPEQ